MRVRAKATWGFMVVASIALAGCTSNNSPGGNPGAPSTGGGTPTATTTITIASSGVSPKSIIVPRGSQVTFINSNSVPHEMASDPHPTHGSCPEIESGVGFISPGQSKLTGNLNTAKTCGYHDHNRDFDTTLQGTIVVQ